VNTLDVSDAKRATILNRDSSSSAPRPVSVERQVVATATGPQALPSTESTVQMGGQGQRAKNVNECEDFAKVCQNFGPITIKLSMSQFSD